MCVYTLHEAMGVGSYIYKCKRTRTCSLTRSFSRIEGEIISKVVAHCCNVVMDVLAKSMYGFALLKFQLIIDKTQVVIRTYVRTYKHTCMHTYIHACIHVRIHIYVHTSLTRVG